MMFFKPITDPELLRQLKEAVGDGVELTSIAHPHLTPATQWAIKEEAFPHLERWGSMKCPNGQSHIHLLGYVYGHPGFNNGDFIVTSGIEWAHWGLRLARSLNTLYALVGPDLNAPK